MQTSFEFELSTAPSRGPEPSDLLGRTFRETRGNAIHRWYAYVEGFSADYIAATLAELELTPTAIYDPFGGAGTTLVEAARRGIPSFFAEANPFMAFVCETKVNSARWAENNFEQAEELLGGFRDALIHPSFTDDARRIDLAEYDATLTRRDFFETQHLRELVRALKLATELASEEPDAARLATLACAANVVGSSNMTRRADLRRRKSGEYKTRVVDVGASIAGSVAEILEDLRQAEANSTTIQVAADCRDLPEERYESFELALTSPPYLNGTNYVRNTKLELFLLGYVTSEAGLAPLRHAGVTGGITQAATSRPIRHRLPNVEEVAVRLDAAARDQRIPHLVRAYFSDMLDALRAVFNGLVRGGHFILDIGDSKFYGVHVPTDRLLAELAETVGFIVERQRLIARRVSRDKTPLVQVDLVLRKPAS